MFYFKLLWSLFLLTLKLYFLNKNVLTRKPILNIYFSFGNWYRKLVSVVHLIQASIWNIQRIAGNSTIVGRTTRLAWFFLKILTSSLKRSEFWFCQYNCYRTWFQLYNKLYLAAENSIITDWQYWSLAELPLCLARSFFSDTSPKISKIWFRFIFGKMFSLR